jgi:hypothetical protein
MTCDGDVYTAVIRQAAHDAVRALLSAPPDSIAGPRALREVTTWLAAEHGAAAMIDLAEELAADLAEAFDAVAAAEGRAALAVLDNWFHDAPPPPLTAPGPTRAADPGCCRSAGTLLAAATETRAAAGLSARDQG